MKTYIKSSFLFITIGFLPLASNFLLTPFFTRYLTPEEYGVLALAAIMQAYLSIMLALGIDGAFTRMFYEYYKKPKLLNAFLSTVLICILSVALLYFAILQFSGDFILRFIFNNAKFTFSQYGNLIYFTTVATLVHTVCLVYYRNNENMRGFATLSISMFLLMTLGSIIGVIVLGMGAMGSIAGKMAGAVITVSCFLIYFFSRHPIRFRKKFLKPAYQYGLPLIPYLLLGLTLDNIDRFYMERFFPLAELGKYNIAFLIASVIAVILQSVMSATHPTIYKMLSDRNETNRQEVNKEINFIFRILHLFIITLIVGAIVLVDPMIKIFIAPDYHSIVLYMPLLFLAYIPRLYYVIYGIPLFFHYKSKLLPVINFVALVAGAAINLVLVWFLGLIGICLGVVVVKLLQTIMAIYYVRKFGYMEKSLFTMRSSHILAMGVTAGAMASVMLSQRYPENSGWFNLLVGAAFLVILLLFFRKELLAVKGKAMAYLNR